MARPVVKRANIERAVVRVVAEKGLRGATIQDIATAAEVSPGLLYRYWPNRDALAAEVYVNEYVAIVERIAGKANEAADFTSRVRALVTGFFAAADAEPERVRFLLLSQHDLAACVPSAFGIRRLIGDLIEQGIQEGIVREMPKSLAVQLMLGICLQPVVGVLYGDLEHPVSRFSDEICQSLIQALAG